MISVHFQGKPFNITVIQVYAPTSNTEEAEVERFYEDLQEPCSYGVATLRAETDITMPHVDTPLSEGRAGACALKKNKTAQGGGMGVEASTRQGLLNW